MSPHESNPRPVAAQGTEATPAVPPRAAPRRPRWMDAATVVLLLLAASGVLFTAASPLLRAAGLSVGPEREGEGVTLLPPDPHDRDLHPPIGEGALKHPPFLEEDDDEPPAAAARPQRFGVVRRRVSILEQPAPGARSLGDVEPGELVAVVREVGDFALVVYSGEDGALMGWAKKSEIAVR